MAAEDVDASLRSFGLKIWSPYQDHSEDVTNQITLIAEQGLRTDTYIHANIKPLRENASLLIILDFKPACWF